MKLEGEVGVTRLSPIWWGLGMRRIWGWFYLSLPVPTTTMCVYLTKNHVLMFTREFENKAHMKIQDTTTTLIQLT